MAQIKFERTSAPTGSVTFSVNPPEGGYGGRRDYIQPVDRASGGDVYCYEKALPSEEVVSFNWGAMPATDFTNLMTFWDVAKGRKYNFTFTDYDSSTHTARFWSEITWDFRENGTLAVSFDIRIES
jgi:hypothetical protein